MQRAAHTDDGPTPNETDTGFLRALLWAGLTLTASTVALGALWFQSHAS